MASRNASRIVMVTISVPSGTSVSGASAASGVGGAMLAGRTSASGSSDDRDSSTRCSSTGSGCDLALRAGGLPSFSAAASSPSARIMAIGVLTATSLVPSGTKIRPRVPSSTASTSMVALSVSISAMTSPDLTVSPSFLCHLARLPFSIVGESAGIRTSIGMGHHRVDRAAETRARCVADVTARRAPGKRARSNLWSPTGHILLGVDVAPELGRVGLRVAAGEFGRFVDDGAYFGIDLLQRVFARKAPLQQAAAHLLDRIVLGAHLVDFLFGSVLGGIRHGMAAIAVSQHFQNDRTVALATPLHRHVGR